MRGILNDMNNNNYYNYNPSFTSRINVISWNKFAKLPEKGYEFIDFDEFGNNDRKLANKFKAFGIRTCCGGGLTSKHKDVALGFHVWGNKCNLKNIISEIDDYAKNKDLNGFLIGGKNLYDTSQSVINFNNLQKTLKRNLGDFSYFKMFKKKYGEAYICYSKDTDTWNISLSYFNSGSMFSLRHTATKLKSFLAMFEEIHISDKDVLFIGGKQITKDIAPQIFSKAKNK